MCGIWFHKKRLQNIFSQTLKVMQPLGWRPILGAFTFCILISILHFIWLKAVKINVRKRISCIYHNMQTRKSSQLINDVFSCLHRQIWLNVSPKWQQVRFIEIFPIIFPFTLDFFVFIMIDKDNLPILKWQSAMIVRGRR